MGACVSMEALMRPPSYAFAGSARSLTEASSQYVPWGTGVTRSSTRTEKRMPSAVPGGLTADMAEEASPPDCSAYSV